MTTAPLVTADRVVADEGRWLSLRTGGRGPLTRRNLRGGGGQIDDWLDAGTRLVVVVDPESQTVNLYRPREDVRVLTIDDVLEGGDVVPDWTLPVRDIFL